MLHGLLLEMNELNYIEDDIFYFLNPFFHNLKTNEMYFLPKLHTLPLPDAPFEVRPIMSGVNSATYTISKFVDYFLASIAESQSTYKGLHRYHSKATKPHSPSERTPSSHRREGYVYQLTMTWQYT